MRALIAATCIAVLAVVGYYFWGEYTRYSKQRAEAAEAIRVRNIEDLASITGRDCRTYTEEAVSAHDAGRVMDPTSERRLRLCVNGSEMWPFDRSELKRIGWTGA